LRAPLTRKCLEGSEKLEQQLLEITNINKLKSFLVLFQKEEKINVA
jgi:hypothetical protein